MGALTPIDKVWYPDETDLDQPNVYMATHSQSIEEGIGARLRKQEQFIGFMGHLPKQVYPNLANGTAYGPLPFQTIQGSGSFNQGMQVAGGVVTAPMAGLYSITLSTTITNISAEFATRLYQNQTQVWKGYTQATTGSFGYNTGSVVVKCEAGDTISAKITVYASNNLGKVSNNDYVDNVLSIAMLKAAI